MERIRMVEKWSGTRGSFYIYVCEDKVLRHISHYAVKKEKINNLVFYEVPISKISGKKIFLVDFTCSGYGFIREHKVEDRIDPQLFLKMYKCKVLKGLGVLEKEGIEMLKDYEFEINDNELKQLINEFETTYLQMINEIKEYKERLKFEIFFARHAERTRNVFKNPEICYLSCLFLPDDRRRKMSLRNVCKWIYQLWILKLFCEAVETIEIVKKEKRKRVSRSYWWIEQGSPYPTCILDTPFGYITCWFEFQVHEMIHLKGMFTGRREYVRPDIVVAKGFHETAKTLDKINLIIECKVREFKYWKNDIYDQIPAYISEFNPDSLILTSFKPIPNEAKKFLESKDIIVIDNLRPNSLEVEMFKERVKRIIQTV